MKFLLPLLRNNILQLSHANQLRYADTKNRTKTITLYMLIAAILMGLLAYLIYSLKIIYSIAWSLEEVVTELVIPMVLICVSLNIAISVFGEVACSLAILILTVCLHSQFRCVH